MELFHKAGVESSQDIGYRNSLSPRKERKCFLSGRGVLGAVDPVW